MGNTFAACNKCSRDNDDVFDHPPRLMMRPRRQAPQVGVPVQREVARQQPNVTLDGDVSTDERHSACSDPVAIERSGDVTKDRPKVLSFEKTNGLAQDAAVSDSLLQHRAAPDGVWLPKPAPLQSLNAAAVPNKPPTTSLKPLTTSLTPLAMSGRLDSADSTDIDDEDSAPTPRMSPSHTKSMSEDLASSRKFSSGLAHALQLYQESFGTMDQDPDGVASNQCMRRTVSHKRSLSLLDQLDGTKSRSSNLCDLSALSRQRGDTTFPACGRDATIVEEDEVGSPATANVPLPPKTLALELALDGEAEELSSSDESSPSPNPTPKGNGEKSERKRSLYDLFEQMNSPSRTPTFGHFSNSYGCSPASFQTGASSSPHRAIAGV